ncbi:MAG: sulfatase [Myxococcales bacterium]|nr:sulfatase [Myxococcales bacterium]
MNVARNLIQGTAGGLLGGALLGLSEAVFHLVTSGAPDLVAPLYATVLYGLVGLPLGFGAGLALTAYERVRYPLRRRAAARAFCLGGSFAVLPVLAYVLQYVVKKVVFLEQAVPASALAGIVLGVAILGVVLMTLGVRLVNGPLSFLLKGPGALGSWLLLVAVTAVAAVAGPGGGAGASTSLGKSVPAGLADAPNVLLIVVDTLRADALGTYGAEGDPTPALDAIAADGIVFEQAFSHASWTRASFASLFSSRLPTSHTASTKASSLPDEVELVSEVLQEGGVATIDLVNNINVTASFNFDQGWDLFLYEKPDFVFWGTESTFALTLYKVVHKLHERLIGSHEVTRFYQPAEVVLGHLLDFVHANSGARWFAVAHLMEPHDPYFPHPYLQGTGSAEVGGEHYGRAEHEAPALGDAAHMATLYADEVRHLDRKLADLVAALKAQDLYDDLMIVVTADHGEEFGEHGGFWHGTTLFDEQIHVPLLVKLPRQRPGGHAPARPGALDRRGPHRHGPARPHGARELGGQGPARRGGRGGGGREGPGPGHRRRAHRRGGAVGRDLGGGGGAARARRPAGRPVRGPDRARSGDGRARSLRRLRGARRPGGGGRAGLRGERAVRGAPRGVEAHPGQREQPAGPPGALAVRRVGGPGRAVEPHGLRRHAVRQGPPVPRARARGAARDGAAGQRVHGGRGRRDPGREQGRDLLPVCARLQVRSRVRRLPVGIFHRSSKGGGDRGRSLRGCQPGPGWGVGWRS